MVTTGRPETDIKRGRNRAIIVLLLGLIFVAIVGMLFHDVEHPPATTPNGSPIVGDPAAPDQIPPAP